MKYRHAVIIVFTAVVVMLSSCRSNDSDAARMVADWIGRRLLIPDDLVFQVKDDTVELDLSRPDFKIVSYVDSSGCTSCRMKLQEWNRLIAGFKSLADVDVEVVTIVNPMGRDEVLHLLHRNDYLNPVAFDTSNAFETTNNLPSKSAYHTFLLDSDGLIVAMGNPVNNPKIKDLYLRHISSACGSEVSSAGSAMSDAPVRALGALSRRQSASMGFYLHNTDADSLSLQAIVPSCDCLSAEASFASLAPDATGRINVVFSGDTVPGQFLRYVDIFFNETENPERLIVYGYIN